MTETQPPPDSGGKPTPKPEAPAPGPVPAAKAAPPSSVPPAGMPSGSVPSAAASNASAKPPAGPAKPIGSGTTSPPGARPTTTPPPAAPNPLPPRRSAGAVLTAIGFVLLFIGLAWVWTQQQQLANSMDPERLAQLDTQIAGLQQRVARLEQAPPPAAPPAPVDLRPLEARVTALEQRPAPQAAPSESPALTAQLNALQQRLGQAEQAQAGTAARAAKLARLQAAAAALAAGKPLGEIPGAPPALTRFATTPPPTEAQLRLDFDAAAARAAEASKPTTEADSLAEKMWLRVQSLVTVRDGDRVLSGAPASYVLGAAREQLTAGNLEGAVADVERLDKAAAAAMADWHDRARALLDARAALAKLAAAD